MRPVAMRESETAPAATAYKAYERRGAAQM